MTQRKSSNASDYILNLVVKNVTKDSPLSDEEVQILKAFRDQLTTEQWNTWLQVARKEKRRRKEMGSSTNADIHAYRDAPIGGDGTVSTSYFLLQPAESYISSDTASQITAEINEVPIGIAGNTSYDQTNPVTNDTEIMDSTFNPTPLNSLQGELLQSDDLFDDFKLLEISDGGNGDGDPYTVEDHQVGSIDNVDNPIEIRTEEYDHHQERRATHSIKLLEIENLDKLSGKNVSHTNPIETQPLSDGNRAQPQVIIVSDEGSNHQNVNSNYLRSSGNTGEIIGKGDLANVASEYLASIATDSRVLDTAVTAKPTPWKRNHISDREALSDRAHQTVVTTPSSNLYPSSAVSVAAAKMLWEERLLPKQTAAQSSQAKQQYMTADQEKMPPPRQLQGQRSLSSLKQSFNREEEPTSQPVEIPQTLTIVPTPSPYAPPRPLNSRQTMPTFRETNANSDDYQSDSNATDESVQSQQSYFSTWKIAENSIQSEREDSVVQKAGSASSVSSATGDGPSEEVSLRIIRHARSSTPKRTTLFASDSASQFSAALPEPQQVPSQLSQQFKLDDTKKSLQNYLQLSTQPSWSSNEGEQARRLRIPQKMDTWTEAVPPPAPSKAVLATNENSMNNLYFNPPAPPQYQGIDSVGETSSKDSITTTLPQLRRKSIGSHSLSTGPTGQEIHKSRRPAGDAMRSVGEGGGSYKANNSSHSNNSQAKKLPQYFAPQTPQDGNSEWDRSPTSTLKNPPPQRALSPPHPVEMLAAKQRVFISGNSLSTPMQPMASQTLQDPRQLFSNRDEGDLALTSVRHLDAACTAAKSLLTSFKGPQSRDEQRYLDSKMTALSEMINSLENSKDAIAQLLQTNNKVGVGVSIGVAEPVSGPVDWDQYYAERGRSGVRYVNQDPMTSPHERFHDTLQWEEGDMLDDNTSMSTFSARQNGGGSLSSGRKQGGDVQSIGAHWNTGDRHISDGGTDEQELNFQDYFFNDSNLHRRNSEIEVNRFENNVRAHAWRQSERMETKHSRPPSSSRTTAICIAQGALVAAFDDFPIRTNVGSASVDVVWRENLITTPIPVPIPRNSPLRPRRGSSASSRGHGRSSRAHGSSNLRGRSRSRSRSPSSSYPSYPFSSTVPASSSSAPTAKFSIPSKTGSVLRRERFLFDDVLAGPYANRDLTVFMRKRCRQALSAGDDLAVLCLACGESAGSTSLQPISELPLEPSVGLLLGSGGGSGLLHALVSELLRCLGGNSEKWLQQSFNGDPTSLPNSAHIVISAVVIPTHSRARASTPVIDLFSVANNRASYEKTSPGLRIRRDNGKVELVGVKRLQLHSSADVDRLAGLLLGTRSTALEMLAQHCRSADGDANSSSDSLNSVGAASDCGGTMMLQLGIKGGVSRSRLMYTFSLLAPCGPTWSCPGIDMDILTECMASAPHSAPPSLLKLSPLSSLLMGGPQRVNPFQLLTVVSVHRCQAPRQQPSGKVKPVEVLKAAEQDHVMLQDTLRMMKIACRHVMQ